MVQSHMVKVRREALVREIGNHVLLEGALVCATKFLPPIYGQMTSTELLTILVGFNSSIVTLQKCGHCSYEFQQMTLTDQELQR
eukprot:scaffold118352_cov29-Prasinocladus_malaysianus.AAC.2